MKNNLRSNCIQQIKIFSILFLSFIKFQFVFGAYCETNLGGSTCFNANQIISVELLGTSLSNLNNTCANPNGSSFSLFPASGNTTTNLEVGSTYTLAVTTTANNTIGAWIDFDHNLSFDANEYFSGTISVTAYNTGYATFNIPSTATVGQTRMRVRSRTATAAVTATTACSSFGAGETEDYIVTITASPQCNASVVAGNAKSSVLDACAGANFILSLTGTSQLAGLTYQWQSSPDSVNWSSLLNDTLKIQSISLTSSTYYRCIVSCSGVSDTSGFCRVMNRCYCQSAASVTKGIDISKVTIANLSNGILGINYYTLSALATYSDFTALPTANLEKGVAYPITVHMNYSSSFIYNYILYKVSVFIDFDHDGLFNGSNEMYPIDLINTRSTTNLNTTSGILFIPDSVPVGRTRMRIVLMCDSAAQPMPCGIYGNGETEDYSLNILAGSNCTGTPTAGSVMANDSAICVTSRIELSLSGNSYGLGQGYQWQSSPDSLNWTNILGANSAVYVDTVEFTTYFRCLLSCSGNVETSSPLKITRKTLNQCYCVSGEISTPTPANTDIAYFSFGNFVHASPDTTFINPTYAVNSYSDYTALTPFVLNKGATYPVNIVSITSSLFTNWQYFFFNACRLFIDFDQNTYFDGGYYAEYYTVNVFQNSSGVRPRPNHYFTSITIPSGVPTGITRMRIRNNMSSGTSCGLSQTGETEDYLVYIDYPLSVIHQASTEIQNNLLVYPNPSNEYLNISYSIENDKLTQLKLINLSGQVVYEETFSNKLSQAIAVSSFRKGIYLLQLTSENNTTTRKIVIE